MLGRFCSKLSPKCAAEYHYGWLPCCLIISKFFFFFRCCNSFMLVLHLEKVMGLNLQGSGNVICRPHGEDLSWAVLVPSCQPSVKEAPDDPLGLLMGWSMTESRRYLDPRLQIILLLESWGSEFRYSPKMGKERQGWQWDRRYKGFHSYIWGSVEWKSQESWICSWLHRSELSDLEALPCTLWYQFPQL